VPSSMVDDVTTSEAEAACCRICFDGAEAGTLVAPCRCSGTQASVHEACLLRWRRLQIMQGKHAAANQCGICGEKYTASLAAPVRPFRSHLVDFSRVLLDTILALVVCALTSPLALASRTNLPLFLMGGMPCLIFGVVRGAMMFAALFPMFVLFLYMNGMKLSVLGEPGRYIVGFTSFGAPVDGLRPGMLLVSIGARGCFEQTVLYVLEHSDVSTLALILNKPVESGHVDRRLGNGLAAVSIRSGGPLTQRLYCIHNIEGIPGAERLLAGESVFLSQGLEAIKRGKADETASLALIKGFASWGSHQLEGEVRRGAWGWIKPEDVRPEDLFEMDHPTLDRMWERLLNAPYLQIFEQ